MCRSPKLFGVAPSSADPRGSHRGPGRHEPETHNLTNVHSSILSFEINQISVFAEQTIRPPTAAEAATRPLIPLAQPAHRPPEAAGSDRRGATALRLDPARGMGITHAEHIPTRYPGSSLAGRLHGCYLGICCFPSTSVPHLKHDSGIIRNKSELESGDWQHALGCVKNRKNLTFAVAVVRQVCHKPILKFSLRNNRLSCLL
jgi:hypothetical protein